jgi:hypothetical protein
VGGEVAIRSRSDSVREEILRSGADDYVGLWEAARTAREFGIVRSETEISAAVIEAIGTLIKEGHVEIGDLDRAGFRPWSPQSAEVITWRIQDAWTRLGRDPDIGEICWMRLTASGELEATVIDDS